MPDALVSTDWLQTHLEAPDVRVVDATWFLPGTERSARAEYEAAHIPGAVFFDLDAVCEPKGLHPHMVPSAAKFSSRVRKLGLGDGSRIVVYDDNRFFASARVWWLFRFMGHDDVMVLDGGLAKWRAEERPLTDMPTRPQERHFTVRQNNLIHRELDQMRANLTSRREQVVDARSAGRFHAREPEPRAGLRSGHIPGARNLHYAGADRGRRHLEARGRAAPGVRGRRRGHGPAGGDELRLGRVGGADQPGPVRARRAQRGALRRLVGRMGRAGGHAGRDVT